MRENEDVVIVSIYREISLSPQYSIVALFSIHISFEASPSNCVRERFSYITTTES